MLKTQIAVKEWFLLRHDYEPGRASSKNKPSFARIISLNHIDSITSLTPTTYSATPFTITTTSLTPFPPANPVDQPRDIGFPPPSFLDAMDTTHSV